MSALLLRYPRGVAQSAIASIRQFSALSSPAIDANDFGPGAMRGFRDVTTGDIVWPCYNSANNKVEWWTSQDLGVTNTKLSADFTTPSGTFPNFVVSCMQTPDAVAHLLSFSSANIPYYTRLSIARSGGHVTGIDIDQAPLALGIASNPGHGYDRRGCLDWIVNSGTYYPIWITQGFYSSDTTCRIYGGLINGTSGATTSVGITGTGTSTLLKNIADNGIGYTNTETSHMLAVERSTGNFCLFYGSFNTDDYTGTQTPNDWANILGTYYVRSGTTWGSGTDTNIYTLTGTTDPPKMCGTASSNGKALLLYYTNGNLRVGYYDASGTWTDTYLTTIATQAARAYSGCLSSDGTKLFVVWMNYGTSGSPADGGFAYNDGIGGGWQKTAQTSPVTLENLVSAQWSTGLLAIRGDGDTQLDSRTGNSVASIYLS